MVAAVETMAYTGEVPWHGLGKDISAIPPADLTPVRMMKESGTDWTVSKKPLYMEGDSGERIETEYTALIRDTDKSILTYVPEDWNPLQNADAFAFFDEFVKAGEMQMETAGSLLGGRRVWALARINDTFRLRFGKKEDVIENHLLFSNPHEFGRTITIDLTSVRVVCNNTLTLALSKASSKVVKVSHRNVFDPEAAKAIMFSAAEQMKEYKERAEFLSSKRFNSDTVRQYFAEVFPSFSKKHTADNDNLILSRNAETALSVIDTQPGAKLGEGTWWQPYNAVTYLMDHHLGRTQEGRVNNIWFGQMKDKKITALNKALEYAKNAA